LTLKMATKLSTNPDRIDLDEAYLQMAEIWAKRSKAVRKQVGALIVKDKQIISDGYNGMPAGDPDDVCEYKEYATGDEGGWLSIGEIVQRWPHIEPADHPLQASRRYALRTKPEVLHAESNALMKLAENGGIGAQGATLYLTMSPCTECAKLIKQAKIKRVIFREQYREVGGIEFLKKRGVEVVQLEKK
jgi:dCMP deaminase